MIGIINEIMEAYSIAEKINNSFPKINIYLYIDNNIDKGIDLLSNNNCNVIVLPSNLELSYYKKKYSNITFLSLDTYKVDGYVLDDEELFNSIDKHQEQLVRKILDNKKIEEKTIIINNPKLLFIKNIIEDIYPDKIIIDKIDYLIKEINKIELIESKGEIKIIGERE